MDSGSNESKQDQTDHQDAAYEDSMSQETASHLRNLILKSSITVMSSVPSISVPKQQEKEPDKEVDKEKESENENRKIECTITSKDEVPPSKKPKFSECENASSPSYNPLESLPLSLISNGTLSVTSDSACVTVENGIPILKEINDVKKPTTVEKQEKFSVTAIVPAAVVERKTANLEIYTKSQSGAYNTFITTTTTTTTSTTTTITTTSTMTTTTTTTSATFTSPLSAPIAAAFAYDDKSFRSFKPFAANSNSNSNDNNKMLVNEIEQQDACGINKIILKALTEVTKETSLSKIGLIPNPSQMNFLTLLGLEIVVDSCCPTSSSLSSSSSSSLSSAPSSSLSDASKRATATPFVCKQCCMDFTTNWHFFKNPLSVLCDRCYLYNEHQVLKAAQTVRLAKEYSKLIHTKQANVEQYRRKDETKSYAIKSDSRLAVAPTSLALSDEENHSYEDFISTARLGTKDNYVCDLAALGASIATNSEIFEAAKTVNSLGSNATPLSRALAVQNLQSALFRGLDAKLSPCGANAEDGKMPEKTLLLSYQNIVAKMMNEANIKSLQQEDQSLHTPLNGIISSAEALHQNLMKGFLKQLPNPM